MLVKCNNTWTLNSILNKETQNILETTGEMLIRTVYQTILKNYCSFSQMQYGIKLYKNMSFFKDTTGILAVKPYNWDLL